MFLPPMFMTWLAPFRCCFQERTWQRILVLQVGTLLAHGRRTVPAVLRQMGHQDDPHFSSYHRVFNRASRSLTQASTRGWKTFCSLQHFGGRILARTKCQVKP
jgi:hypothetical protein